MSATLTIPESELRKFNETLRRRIAVGRSDGRDIVNSKALDVAFRSMKNTRMADRREIEHTLGVSSYRVSLSKKTGQFKRRGVDIIEDSFAARIVNARHKAAGEPLVFGAQLLKEARAMIAARVRAVTFLKAGWLPAIRRLGAVAKDAAIRAGARAAGVRAFGKPKGSAVPAANNTAFPVATITNAANGGSQTAAGYVATGLGAGLAESMADMEVYIARKVAESNAKIFT